MQEHWKLSALYSRVSASARMFSLQMICSAREKSGSAAEEQICIVLRQLWSEESIPIRRGYLENY